MIKSVALTEKSQTILGQGARGTHVLQLAEHPDFIVEFTNATSVSG